VLFLARGVVQATLYHENATGWLAFARVAMGYPLYIAAVGSGYWIVRRARHGMRAKITDELAATEDADEHADPTSGAPGRPSADDSTPDRGLGLR
jgi:hypothetical protein